MRKCVEKKVCVEVAVKTEQVKKKIRAGRIRSFKEGRFGKLTLRGWKYEEE